MKKLLLMVFLLCRAILFSQNNKSIEMTETEELSVVLDSVSVKALDNFIILHPDSKLKNKAIIMRDSLALPKDEASFYEFSGYVTKYPNSRYSAYIMEKLPDLLDRDLRLQTSYHSTIELIKAFVVTYPNHPNTRNLRTELEIFYARSINHEFNIEEYKDFKILFPESRFYFDKTTKKMRSRSDGKYSIAAPEKN